MKRTRTHALGFVLDHRKKVLKGLGALLQILEKLPEGTSVADLVTAKKTAATAKATAAKEPPKSKTKARPKTKKAPPAARQKSAAVPGPSPAVTPADEIAVSSPS